MRIPLLSQWLAKKALIRGTQTRHEAAHLLGIEGLPFNTSELMPGKIYGLMLPEGMNSHSLVLDTLENGVKVGLRVGALSVRPQVIKSALRARDALAKTSGNSGPVSLFALNLEELGEPADAIWTVMTTLELCGGDDQDCMIYQSANLLFPSKSRARVRRQIGIFRDWHKYHHSSGIFVFSENADLWSYLVRYAPQFTGLARLSQEDSNLSWQVNHWDSSENSAGIGSFPIGRNHTESLYSLTIHNNLSASLKTPPDQHNVLFIADAETAQQTMPTHWYAFKNMAELIADAMTAIGATIILDYRHEDEWLDLCRSVHELRLNCGRRLKILIHEKGGRIDYGKEMLLYRLGANLLVHEDLSFSLLFRTVSSLKSQVYGRDINPDFDALYIEANPDSRVGYMPPLDFASAADEFLRCSVTTGIESVMARFTLQPSISHLEALKACYVGRPGIFYTVDATYLYVFLFACPILDAETTLTGTFTRSLNELFLETLIESQQSDINTSLIKIRYNAEYVGYTDFSDALLDGPGTEAAGTAVTTDDIIKKNSRLNEPVTDSSNTDLIPDNVVELRGKLSETPPRLRTVISSPLPLKRQETTS